ncbi:Glycosyltransferase involved in cell wall bisynthesis [Salegentibacter echinorum]|uniref:Glycosyltransferase involved in cell wall bisynthesis n=1 Tax=Salegentibacter echinorum TaxID=1073325 RepID=A0A1M5JVP2_SALEC|nr:glycosyltransferase family 2 protein [Salegentibacter echinorum]SHG44485.1 Glycosyltransferase involved in cell wall bisynthesis [Salegentibacter echinorum]
MSQHSQKVTIIMATYNRAHFIEETLDSILSQTYKDWECLIMDDGSEDNTIEVLQPYLEKDTRFKYLKRTAKYKKGLPGCRNMGLDIAKGDFIIFFDDDDIVHPENLKISVKNFNNKVGYVRYVREVFWGDFHYNFDRSSKYNSELLDISVLDKMITNKIPFNSCQVMWRRECYNKNRFNESLMYAEEWECYSRILSSGIKGVSIDEVLFYGRKHPNSNTGEFKNRSLKRRKSKIIATKLIIDNLRDKKLLSNSLQYYFIRLGFELQELEILNYAVANSKLSWIRRIAYSLGYKFYPILKPIFKLKGKLKMS